MVNPGGKLAFRSLGEHFYAGEARPKARNVQATFSIKLMQNQANVVAPRNLAVARIYGFIQIAGETGTELNPLNSVHQCVLVT